MLEPRPRQRLAVLVVLDVRHAAAGVFRLNHSAESRDAPGHLDALPPQLHPVRVPV